MGRWDGLQGAATHARKTDTRQNTRKTNTQRTPPPDARTRTNRTILKHLQLTTAILQTTHALQTHHQGRPTLNLLQTYSPSCTTLATRRAAAPPTANQPTDDQTTSDDRAVASTKDDQARMASLAADVEAFKQAKAAAQADGDDKVTTLERVVDTLGTILSYNFLVIVAFFAWFLAGVFGQYVVKDLFLISAFPSFWDVLILPLLSTHMALTLLSAGLARLTTAK